MDVLCQDEEAVWLQLKEWVTSNHGMVHPALKSNMTHHRGFPVRGVISTETLWTWTPVLTIPSSLWVDWNTFPQTKTLSLPNTVECQGMHSPTDRDTLKFMAGLALEDKKSTDSFYYPWLRSLPSFADFHSFLPRLMEPSVRKDFAALPFVTAMAKAQEQDTTIKACYQAWQKERNSPVASIDWQDVSKMLSAYRTRAIDGGGGMPFIIPAMDLMNTENGDRANSQWHFASDAFILSTELTGLQAGAELTEEYCPSCSNFVLMAIWGVYLEDNLNDLPEMDTAFCQSHAHSGDRSNFTGSQSSTSLRQVTEAMLDVDSLSSNPSRRAPRCRTEMVEVAEQGPLRCSLARLAWEQCHAEWYARSAPNITQPKTKLKLRGASKTYFGNDFAMLLSQSFIGAVAPKLLSDKSESARRQPTGTLHRSIVQGGMMLSAKGVL